MGSKFLLGGLALGALYLAALPMQDGKGSRLLAFLHALSTGNSQAIIPATKGKRS